MPIKCVAPEECHITNSQLKQVWWVQIYMLCKGGVRMRGEDEVGIASQWASALTFSFTSCQVLCRTPMASFCGSSWWCMQWPWSLTGEPGAWQLQMREGRDSYRWERGVTATDERGVWQLQMREGCDSYRWERGVTATDERGVWQLQMREGCGSYKWERGVAATDERGCG